MNAMGSFASHRTASRLLVALLLVAGLLAMTRLNTQFFPDMDVPVIDVTVSWPGASSSDVEENILSALEPDLQVLDDLDHAVGVARAGSAAIALEFKVGTDMKAALSNVEQTISRINTLPATSEPPEITRAVYYEHVATLSVSGPFSERDLKSHAKRIRKALLASGVDRVVPTGFRDEEIWVRVREDDLRRLSLSIEDISRRIRENMLDLPSGTVEGGVNRQIRFLSNRHSAEAMADIEVKSRGTGQKVFLGDIADIQPSFDRDGKIGLSHGHPAIQLTVQRSRSADTLETMATLENQIAALRPMLPAALEIETFDVRAKFIKQTLAVLIANGLQGFLLVIAILFVFLDRGIAIWVAAGIPVALMAALAVMYATGQTLNLISMLALIMMVGVIVDDAVIVGERVAKLRSGGLPAGEAAERGATTMFSPVVVASLTTMAAFLPVLFVTGPIGAILSAIPFVVCAVLIASLFECFVILPVHLRHGLHRRSGQGHIRSRLDECLARFRDGPYRSLLEVSHHWRHTTIAVAVSLLALSLALLSTGRVGFTFFASPEAENIAALVEFGAGTPRAEQMAALERIEQAIYDAEARLLEHEGTGPPRADPARTRRQDRLAQAEDSPHQSSPGTSARRLVETTFVTIGQAGPNEGRGSAEIKAQLTPNEARSIRTAVIVDAWREALPAIAGIERITISQRRSGPPGRDIDVRLKDAPIDKLKLAAEELKDALSAIPGVSAISDDLPWGEPELILELTPRGAALGFTSASVGQQVRNAFEGAIATRFSRGEEEISVRVLRVQKLPGTAGLRELFLVTPDGNRVPIGEVVKLEERNGFSTIRHEDGVRTVAVTADIDRGVTSVPEVLRQLEDAVLPGIVQQFGPEHAFAGRAEDRAKAFEDVGFAALIAVLLIFMILAWGLESYVKPLIVMAGIPFGIVGAIFGHWVMGFDVTIMSLIGFLGLSGVLVNGSVILLTEANRRQTSGEPFGRVTVAASQDRFRAVLLTALTTIAGLLPLLLETNRNAQFLIPMAIALVFGLIAGTLIVLVLTPALAGLGDDITKMGKAASRLLPREPNPTRAGRVERTASHGSRIASD